MDKKRKSLRLADNDSISSSITNDDEAERSLYRRRLEERTKGPLVRENSVSSIQSDSSTAPAKSILETFTAKQLNDHFTSCIKLSAENKINVKNAFELQLIDYMTIMLKKKDPIMNDFSVASTTLDASAKIYGCRVDSLFQNVVSVATTFATNKKGQNDEDGEDGVEEGAEGEGPRRKKKKRPKKTVLSETSLNSINRKVIEKGPWNKFLIDYTDNTMLLNSGLHHETLGVTMSNNYKYFPEERYNYEPSTQIIKVPLPELLSTAEICPTFAKFSWDLAESATTFTLESDLEHAFDINRTPEPIPEVEYDNHFDDVGAADDYDEEAIEVVGMEKLTNAVKPITVDKITDVTKLLSVEQQEYSYFDDKLLDLWAGPSHWKVRKSSSKRRGDDAQQKARQEKIKQKKEFRIEFNRNLKISHKFKPGTNTQLAEKTVKEWSVKKNTYREDCHANPSDLLRFFLHKRLCIDFKTVLRQQEDLLNCSSRLPVINDANIDNLDSQENYVIPPVPSPNRPIEDDLPDDVGDGAPDDYYVETERNDSFDDNIHPMDDMAEPNNSDLMAHEYTTGAFIGDNLLPVPNKISKVDLQIDTRRKIIDMHLIKKIVWKLLDFENGIKEVKFDVLYRNLLKKVPKNMVQDVTCAVAFAALLTLVNEKSLSMAGGTTDVIVYSTPPNSNEQVAMET